MSDAGLSVARTPGTAVPAAGGVRVPRRDLFVALHLIAVFLCCLVSWTRGDSSGHEMPLTWLPIGLSIPALALSMPTGRPLRSRRLAAVTTAVAVLVCLSGMPWGVAAGDLLRIGVVDALAALGATLAYRLMTGGTWMPRSSIDTLGFCVATWWAVVVAVVAGAVPGGSPTVVATHPHETILWLLHLAPQTIAAALSGIVLNFGPRPAASSIEHRGLLPIGVPLGGLCLALPYLLPQYPLSWLVFVPALWVGLSLTPRLAVLVTGFLALAAFSAPWLTGSAGHLQLHEHFGEGSWVPSQLVMEAVLAAALVLAVMVVSYRENQAVLIAELRERRRRARRQDALLGNVFAGMTEGLVLADRHGHVRMSNPAALSLLGRSLTDSDARTSRVLVAEERAAEWNVSADDIQRIVHPPEHGVAQVDVQVPGGEEQPDRFLRLLSRSVHLRGEDMTLVIIDDVTAASTHERELEHFAGVVAHDLKNPLAALALWIEIAAAGLDDDDPDAGRQALVSARESSRRMQGMIEDYLTYTVSREGTLRPSPVHLGRLTEEVVAPYRTGGAVFTVNAPHVVRADPSLTRQLLANLIANAVKYVRPGEDADVTVRSVADDDGWVRVYVEDHGVGITPGEETAIFDAFRRSAKDTQTTQGIGLGLALCRTIVRRHGGRIRAMTNRDGGASFEFTLPLADRLVRS